MNSDACKKMLKNVSIVMVICFLLPFYFGAPAQAIDPSDNPIAFYSSSPLNKKEFENSANVIENMLGDNNEILSSSSNAVDVSAKVYVKAYTRKSGTKVKSHYRRDPR